MESRRTFMRRTAVGSSALALAGLAGCLDGDGNGTGEDERDYTAWLYDPAQYLEPEFTMFTTVDVDRTKGLAGERFEDQLSTFEEELEEFEGVEDLERLTGLAFGEMNIYGGETGAGVAITGTFDVDALTEELEDTEGFDEERVDREEYEGYDVYTLEDDDETGGMAIRDDTVVFGLFGGIDADATEPVTAVIDEYESAESGYYEARENGADLLDRLEGNLSVTGVEFDATELGLADGADPLATDLYSGLVGVGSASDLEDGNVVIDAVLVYEDDDSADAGTIEDAIEERLEDEPELANLEALEDLEVREDGRVVELSLSFDPAETAVDDPWNDPSVLLYLGAFPAFSIVGAFFLDLGSTATAEAQMGVDVQESDGSGEVTVTVTSVSNAADAYIVTGTTEIHDFEAKAGSSYTLSVEDDEYVPGDTIMVIGVTEDGTETVITSFETGD